MIPLERNSTTRLKDSKVGARPVCCMIVRSLLQSPWVYIYTLVLTQFLVDYDYKTFISKEICRSAVFISYSSSNRLLPYIRSTSSRFPECFRFQLWNNSFAER